MSKLERGRDREDDDRGLNLAPFMNIVAILIPILLLSVVFLKGGVVDVSTPKIAPTGPKPDDSETEDLELTVAVAEDGFEIATADATLPPVDECPQAGPTICLADPDFDVEAQLDRARRALAEGDESSASSALDRAVAAYDFAALYSRLRAIKADHPDEQSLHITASPDIPYKLLIRVMDAVRFKLDEKRYASNDEFWRASTDDAPSHREELFSEPVLAVGK